MENDENIKLSESLKLIVAKELLDKHGIDKWKQYNCLIGCCFTKEELAKITELKIENPYKGDLKGIEFFTNLRHLSITSTQDDKYINLEKVRAISDNEISGIEKCKNLESLTIVNQTGITDIDLGYLPKLKEVNINNNTNLETIDGIDNLSKLEQLSCYGNISLQNIQNLDKAIIQNKGHLKGMNLDVLLFPKAIGYEVNGTYNQEAMNAIEQINGGITGKNMIGFINDKADDKVTWTEPLNLKDKATIGMHSMLKMHNKACQILHDILPRDRGILDTVVAVERYLAENVAYDYESLKHGHSKIGETAPGRPGNVWIRLSHEHGVNGAYDCLVHNSCVCQGYTRGEQYLLGLRGIKTREVSCIAGEDKIGYSDINNHKNPNNTFHLPKDGYHSIIRIDDAYNLYSDPCWNADCYQRGDKSMPYTLRTKDEISKTHTLSSREAGYNSVASTTLRTEVAESIKHNTLFRKTGANEVNVQRNALQQDVRGIVRGSDGRAY